MIFYTAIEPETGHKLLVGTQADARAIDKNFEQIDIPTDKAGLRAFVQDLFTQLDTKSTPIDSHMEQVPFDAPFEEPEPVPMSNTERSLSFEDEWENFSLSLQLHYAALAMESARERIKA